MRRTTPDELNHPCRYKASSADTTARDAARAATVKAPSLRATVLRVLVDHGSPLAAEEIVDLLKGEGLSVLFTTCRSRLSDLKNLGLVEPSGYYGKAFGGCRAIRWKLVTAAIAALSAKPEGVTDGA